MFTDGHPIKKITKQRFFEICASAPGKVTTSTKVPDESGAVGETNTQVVFETLPVGFPELLDAPGLSEKRKKYLFQNIRPFVRPEFQDTLCPPVE